MQYSKSITLLLTATLLTACTEPNGAPGRGVERGGALNKTNVGTAVGAIGGGVLGSAIGGGAGQVVATIGGALLGGMLGNSVGQSLDNADMASYDRASQKALESGRSRTWRHGNKHGTVTPHKRYTNNAGQYCREYSQTIVVDGRTHKGYGTACREDDGSWQIVD